MFYREPPNSAFQLYSHSLLENNAVIVLFCISNKEELELYIFVHVRYGLTYAWLTFKQNLQGLDLEDACHLPMANCRAYVHINPIRPGLFSRSPGPGGGRLRGPDAKNQG